MLRFFVNPKKKYLKVYESFGYHSTLVIADQSGLYDKVRDKNTGTEVRVKGYSKEAGDKLLDAHYATGQIVQKFVDWIDSADDNCVVLYGWGEHYGISEIYSVIFGNRDYDGAYFQPQAYKSSGKGYIYSYLNFEFIGNCLKELLDTDRNPFTFDAFLAGVEVPKEELEYAIQKDFFKEEDHKEILEVGISGFCSIRDFDGIELFSKRNTVPQIKSFLDRSFKNKLQFCDYED